MTKARDEEGSRTFGFALERLELAANSHGRSITTCVAMEARAQAKARVEAERRLASNARIVMDALHAAIRDYGEAAPIAAGMPDDVKVVTVKRWCESALGKLPQPDKSRRRETFERTRSSLINKGLVRQVDDRVWAP